MRNLGQRIGLVHELRQSVGAEEGVDDRRNGLGVDQVYGREGLVVTDIHTFADGTCHTRQTDTELVVELLADGTYATVAQVVNVIYIRLAVDKLDQIFYDGYDVFFGQYLDIDRNAQVEFFVDAITTYITEVITLFAEEKVGDNLASGGIIRSFGVAQLTIDVAYGLSLRIGGILVQGVEDDGVIAGRHVGTLQHDSGHACIKNHINVFLGQLGLTVNHRIGTFQRGQLTGIGVYHILGPFLQDNGGKTTMLGHGFLQVGLIDLHFFGRSKDFDDILFVFKAYGTQKSRYGQLLLAVDIGVHHIIDVSSELNPRTAERDDTRAIKFGTVGMGALSEEYARRTVQLRNDYALGTIDDKGALLGHIRNRSEIHVLYHGVKILVVGVGTVKFKLGFQRHTVGQTALKALIYRIPRRVNVVVQELEHKAVARIHDGEVLGEHLIQAFVISFFGRGVQLQKVLEGLQLYLQKVGIRKRILYRRKINTGFCCWY